LLNPRVHWMQVLGRLTDGMTLKKAGAGLQPWFKAMLHEDTGRADFPVVTAERRRDFLAFVKEILRRQCLILLPAYIRLAPTS